MKRLFVWILFLLAAPCFSQSPPPSAEVEVTAAIAELREGLMSSFTKGDLPGLLKYLDPQVVVTWQNGEVCLGPEAVRAFYERTMVGENRLVREIKSEPEVLGRRVYGDWAVSWGNLHDHFVLKDGSDLPFNSVFTATIAKRNDRWLVTAFHTSINAFENPVLATTTQKAGLWATLAGGAIGLVIGALGARLFRRRQSTRDSR